MMTLDEYETFFITKTNLEIINYLKRNNFIKTELKCLYCNVYCDFIENDRATDGYSWRCSNSSCHFYYQYVNIRDGSFFEDFNVSLSYIFRTILKYSARVPQHSIVAMLDISKPTIIKIIKKLIFKMPESSYGESKLGSGGRLVQVDETMLNYKCKSHRGRSALNRTDSISIVEIENGITRCFAKVIENKQASTLIPIICQNVCHGATIHTDEHRSYAVLRNFGYIHGTVCHKYEFVNNLDNVNTQAVESFHSVMKCWIKARKGVKTSQRAIFLKEFCFYFNNRENYINAILDLLKL